MKIGHARAGNEPRFFLPSSESRSSRLAHEKNKSMARTGEEKGRYLRPRIVQKPAEGETSKMYVRMEK